MTITLTEKENSELWAEAEIKSLQNPEPDEFIYQVPRQLGKGYVRSIEVHPHLWLTILDCKYHDNVLVKSQDCDHPVQFGVLLCGRGTDEYGGQVGEGYTLISGSGIQRKMLTEVSKSRHLSVNMHMPAELLRTFFPADDGDIPPQLKFLTNGNDWQTLIYPQTTTTIQAVAQLLINCPYHGMTKRMYLQGKIQELMALQLAPILAQQNGLQPSLRLKAQTIARIHHARNILLSCLENPPSLVELGQLVGVSERTLLRGFRELFGTTVLGCLIEKRMEQAQQLLRQGDRTVAEVANLLGYSNPAHFATAFKRQFGITPSECLLGKKSVERR